VINHTEHSLFLTSILMSGDFWNSLSPELQQIVEDAATSAARYERELSIADVAVTRERCVNDGITVVDLSAEEQAKFKDATKHLYDTYKDQFSSGLVDNILKVTNMKQPKYVVTAGDCSSDDYAEEHFPQAELISLRLADNGAAAFKKFEELGDDAVLITSTTPLHFSEQSEDILSKYKIAYYYGHLDYTLMSKDENIQYGTNFSGKSLGGISPLVGKIASKLVGVDNFVKFNDPDLSTKAAIDGDIDLVSKPSREGKLDTEGGLHMVCDLTKEFGLKLKYYLITHSGDHDDEALTIFTQEREEISKFLPLLAA
jgi:hypothetical protein